MVRIPPELQAVLNNSELQETVNRKPFLSRRFKAMVLGLSALQYINHRDGGSPEPTHVPEPGGKT